MSGQEKYSLLIDFGNSFAKIALLPVLKNKQSDFFSGEDKTGENAPDYFALLRWTSEHILLAEKRISKQDFTLERLTATLESEFSCHLMQIAECYVCSVRSEAFNERFSLALQQSSPQTALYFMTSCRMQAGIVNGYDNPGQLGNDRWMSALASCYLQLLTEAEKAGHKVAGKLQQPVITADAGSAVNVEFVLPLSEKDSSTSQLISRLPQQDVKNIRAVYQGGLIMPGFATMFNSLTVADNLPLLKVETLGIREIPAKNTHQAILKGAYTAISGALEKIIADMDKSEGTECHLYLTGGDADVIKLNLGSQISQTKVIIRQDLVFIGMVIAAMTEPDLL